MQIDIESPAVAAKWLTVLWTVSMWAWLLIEAISAWGAMPMPAAARASRSRSKAATWSSCGSS